MRSIYSYVLVVLIGVGSSAVSFATPAMSAVSEGSSGGADKDPGKPERAELAKEGRIAIVRGLRGGEPQLTDAEGKHWILVGDFRGELVRLGGHTVGVVGIAAGKKLMTRALKVSAYQIKDSGGKKPSVGRLVQGQNGKLALTTNDQSWEISAGKALLKRLTKRVGCKVWIVGDRADGKLRVEKFGWLRCKPAKALKKDD